ncbi:MAG: transglutaminase family protein [Comamonadaceae bacterium]|nr:MAG: transglutaminase family protein [Comamonadaceae bacterium]
MHKGSNKRRGDDDEPRQWLGSTRLMDLGDPRLRMRAAALVQLYHSDREKALAVYAYVKRLPFERPFKMSPRSARDVLDSGFGDAPDKATLMVALLRLAGVPARLRVVVMRGEIMRGLVDGIGTINRPFVEMWIDGEWQSTDTYIFDAAYMAAARQALRASGQAWSYGVHVESPMLWTGHGSTSMSPLPMDADPMVVQELGLFHDPQHCMASGAFRARHVGFMRFLRWNLLVPGMRRAVDRVRRWVPPAARAEQVTTR